MAKVKIIEASDRGILSPLLNERAASDALAAYYALYHPSDKVKLFASYSGSDQIRGFLVVALTGMDLFRPLAVPFVASEDVLHDLMKAALSPSRPVVVLLPLEQRDWGEAILDFTEIGISELFRLEPQNFEPILNVLVVEVDTPGGLPRYEIRSKTGAFAASGVNWVGDRFAEVYVEANTEGQSRSFATSVLSAIIQRMLGENVVPLFRQEDLAAVNTANLEELGFRPTGTRLMTAGAILKLDDEIK
ncbi:MAG: hypothetical protein GTO18_01105 [Anaerolineales bacterium]|nr:hypothetical protein [Anaerolineales bacterium]